MVFSRFLLGMCCVASCVAFGQPARSALQTTRAHKRTTTPLAIGNLFNAMKKKDKDYGGDCVMGEESIMAEKEHGTTPKRVQSNLRWSCSDDIADRICSFNRHYAENGGYWERSTTFLKEEEQTTEEITFHDSVTGKPLFYSPRGRSWQQFVRESQGHGWPSFRDNEVNWDFVRVLSNGECVSVDGTHLGHNLPDGSGNRYCINLVSVAGRPE